MLQVFIVSSFRSVHLNNLISQRAKVIINSSLQSRSGFTYQGQDEPLFEV